MNWQIHQSVEAIKNIRSLRWRGLGSNQKSARTGKILKGRDIGYALAADSCEGVNSVEARTVTAPDAITAFAVPNPNCSSQIQSVFSGLVALPVTRPG
jgi:hypothetical protein